MNADWGIDARRFPQVTQGYALQNGSWDPGHAINHHQAANYQQSAPERRTRDSEYTVIEQEYRELDGADAGAVNRLC